MWVAKHRNKNKGKVKQNIKHIKFLRVFSILVESDICMDKETTLVKILYNFYNIVHCQCTYNLFGDLKKRALKFRLHLPWTYFKQKNMTLLWCCRDVRPRFLTLAIKLRIHSSLTHCKLRYLSKTFYTFSIP